MEISFIALSSAAYRSAREHVWLRAFTRLANNGDIEVGAIVDGTLVVEIEVAVEVTVLCGAGLKVAGCPAALL